MHDALFNHYAFGIVDAFGQELGLAIEGLVAGAGLAEGARPKAITGDAPTIPTLARGM